MKILVIADVESPYLWDHYEPGRLDGIDLIVSCGDLKPKYLEFLVTLSGKPLLYIPGNHDECYVDDPPGGCECIDGKVFTYQGVRFLGFGGCKHYKDGPYQFTEQQMERNIRRARRSIRKAGGFDVLVTHAAAAGYGDAEDHAHRGFECYKELMDRYQPAYHVHGHVHRSYGWNIPRTLHYGSTTVINAFERYILEI